MKILAFSDWRVQDIEQFIDYLERLDEKPAPIEYEKFLRKKREKSKERIKNNLLIYNQDDLKRTKFIFDLLKTGRKEN